MASWTWDCAAGQGSLQSCNNACYVVNCVPDFSDTTVYYLGRYNTDQHRRESGAQPNPNPCNDGWTGDTRWRAAGERTSGGIPATDCDEFPWASTQQGGTGARLRCVNPSDNRSGGAKLSAFYQSQGWDDDPQNDATYSRSFQVWIENYDDVQYCGNAPDCTNDGGEILLQSTNPRTYVDGKRDLPDDYVDDVTPAKPSWRMRKFLGSDGKMRKLLGRDNGTLPIDPYNMIHHREDGTPWTVVQEILD
ncbi:hypothetical protein KCU65_g5802, partial [Aureobasidium melanogenum]